MSQNTTKFPYEQQAIRGDPMPDVLPYPDQIMFLSLRMLYAQYRMGLIDRETAQADKSRLVKEYDVYSAAESLGNSWVRIIRATETARANFRKNRTLENADELLRAIEGVNF